MKGAIRHFIDTRKDKISFHEIPSHCDLRQKWLRAISRQGNILLQKLPTSIEKLGNKIGLQRVSSEYVAQFLKSNVPDTLFDPADFKKLVFSFEKFKVKKKKPQKKRTLLNAYEQRKLAVFKMGSNAITFDAFVPIHELWVQYMENILQLQNELPKNMSGLYQKLLKADYHGCMLVVASSKCPSYVSVRGIVVQETRNVFRIITVDNKLKTVPKLNTVFAFELKGKIFKIYGTNFRFLPYDRTKLKYKPKSVVNL